MIKRGLPIFLILTFIFVFAGRAGAEVEVVKADGSAEKQERESTTKNKALEDALRNAVSEILENMLKSADRDKHAKKLNRDIYSRPMRYVRNYKVLAEGWVTHYDLPDAPPEGAAEENIEALEEATGETEEGEEALEEELVPPPVTFVEFYHMWVEASVDVGQLRKYLKGVVSFEEKLTTPVSVVILDVVDYASFSRLKKTIEEMSVVKDFSYHSFARGKVEVQVVVIGTGFSFYENLTSKLDEEFAVMNSGVDSVIIQPSTGNLNRGL